MRLIIGGFAQGKLEYAIRVYQIEAERVWDGELPLGDVGPGAVAVNHLHEWIRRRIAEGGCPEEEIFSLIEKNPGCILICNEVGNGIVPADAAEREFRERTGRILIALAEKAEGVDRVLCGIGQRIK